MKMSQIKKLCLAAGKFITVNTSRNGQWLSDGEAAYRMPETLNVTPDMLSAMLDLSQKQIDECGWEEVMPDDERNYADNASGDTILDECALSIVRLGESIDLLCADGMRIALAIRSAYLSPLVRVSDTRLYARPSAGGWLVVVKQGYQSLAVITPMRLTGDVYAQHGLDALAAVMRPPVDEETGEVEGNA